MWLYYGGIIMIKALLSAALLLGLSGTAFAEGRDVSWTNLQGTVGTPGNCEVLVNEKGNPYVCWTIFPGPGAEGSVGDYRK